MISIKNNYVYSYQTLKYFFVKIKAKNKSYQKIIQINMLTDNILCKLKKK